MAGHKEDNIRIIKNTLFLYLRMFFLMCISLYTSRVILQTLGVEDYGIYNVVSGIIALGSFIVGPMNVASQRFFSYEIGRDDSKRLNEVFVTSTIVFIVLSILVVVITEPIGIWFIFSKAQIPGDRLMAAFWAFQCTVISFVISIISIPYNSMIIAKEKMSAFAYISILEGVLKLACALALTIIGFDKLIVYAILVMSVSILIRMIYSMYCRTHFSETKYKRYFDKQTFREILSFAGWNIFAGIAFVGSAQGVNMLLNAYFGPVVNAARGIAVQIQNIINGFASNLQSAINPQIIKRYATREMTSCYNLIFSSSKLSYFLLFVISLPILFYTKEILSLWLGVVPDNAVIFVRLTLVITWIESISSPLVTVVQANGVIKRYQQVVGGLLILIFPLSFLALHLGYSPESVLIINLIVECVAIGLRLLFAKKLTGLNVTGFITTVLIPIALVTFVSIGTIYLIAKHIELPILVGIGLCIIIPLSLLPIFGMSKFERHFVLSYIHKKIDSRKK